MEQPADRLTAGTLATAAAPQQRHALTPMHAATGRLSDCWDIGKSCSATAEARPEFSVHATSGSVSDCWDLGKFRIKPLPSQAGALPDESSC